MAGWLALAVLAACSHSPDPAARLLRDPAAFAIDVEGSTGLGRVTGARLAGDSLAVGYTYPAPEGTRVGRLVGVLDGPAFTGTYDTRGPGTHFRGPARLAFAADGSAAGDWDDGEGTVALVPR